MCFRKNTIVAGIQLNKYLQSYQDNPMFAIFETRLQV